MKSIKTFSIRLSTDRPERSAEHLRHRDFAELWNDEAPDSFKNDPPKAAMTTPGQVDEEPIVLELLTADYVGSTMTFRVPIGVSSLD